MVDLATVSPRGDTRPQKTKYRDTTSPRRQADLPGLEVNAQIHRPQGGGADELARILGLANDLAQNIGEHRIDKRNTRDAAQGSLDEQSGVKNEQAFAKSAAYHRAWSVEGAKKLAVDISSEVTDAVNERLANEDDPATPEDINAVIEQVYRKHITDGHGKPLDFGGPEAQAILGRQLSEVRGNLIGQAHDLIKTKQDERLLGTIADNAVAEMYHGAPIGGVDPLAAQPDPLVALPGTPPDPRPHSGAPVRASTAAVYAAQAHVESGGDPAAVSPKGAVGTMQTMPTTLTSPGFGVKAAKDNSPAELTRVGRDYMKAMVGRYGSLPVALAAYNAGPGVVDDWLHGTNKTGKNPGKLTLPDPHKGQGSEATFWSAIPFSETKHYVSLVTARLGQPIADSSVVDAAGRGDPAIQPVGSATALPQTAVARIDFEALMRRVPTTIDRGTAKKFLLQTLFNSATERNDPRILDGLVDSHRKDGSPSFSPAETATILEQRTRIADKADREADKTRKDRWDANADKLLTAFVDGTPPSKTMIQQWTDRGDIDPNFGFSLTNHIDSEQHQAAAESRQEARIAQAEEDAGFDAFVAGEIATRSVGTTAGASAEDDLRLFNSGALGAGKKAASRFKQLRAAAKAGEQVALQNPKAAYWAERLKLHYGTKPAGGGSILDIRRNKAGSEWNPDDYAAMAQAFENAIKAGDAPGKAYIKAVAEFGPTGTPDVVQARKLRLQELQAKRLTGGR